jgi:hypothetical protein
LYEFSLEQSFFNSATKPSCKPMGTRVSFIFGLFWIQDSQKKENKGASGQACVLRACSSSVLLSCACLGLNFLLVQARRKKTVSHACATD